MRPQPSYLLMRVGLTPLIVCFVGLVGRADSNVSFHYAYFKTHQPLTLDMSRIAVFADDDSGLTEYARRLGQAVDAVAPLPIGGGYVVAADAGVRSAADIRAQVERLGRTDGTRFAAPVFYDQAGYALIPTADVLVGMESGTDRQAARILLERHVSSADRVEVWPALPNGMRIRCGTRSGFESLALANLLAELPEVRFAQPDMVSTSTSTGVPNDPLFGDQWGLDNTGQSGGVVDIDMDLPEAYEYTAGDGSIVIAILDNGIQLDHPDIGVITGADFSGTGTAGGPGNECDNHGTLLAGTIRAIADNGIGVAGVAPQCTLVSVKYGVSTVPCNGFGTFLTSWLVNAIAWCAPNGVRITNNSNGMSQQPAVTSAYQSSYAGGVMHFASSGNNSSPVISYPASLPTVVAVGAVDRTGERAWFSNYGSALALVAPGVEVVTTDRSGADGEAPGDYHTVEGTSFAAPYAAAVAGMVLSVDPSLSPAEVEVILRTTAKDLGTAGYDILYGDGLVQAQAAVEAAGARLPTVTFVECLSGPGNASPPASCSDLQFDLCDFDADQDVDLRDFGVYTR